MLVAAVDDVSSHSALSQETEEASMADASAVLAANTRNCSLHGLPHGVSKAWVRDRVHHIRVRWISIAPLDHSGDVPLLSSIIVAILTVAVEVGGGIPTSLARSYSHFLSQYGSSPAMTSAS